LFKDTHITSSDVNEATKYRARYSKAKALGGQAKPLGFKAKNFGLKAMAMAEATGFVN